jgi:hypothetical protein
MTKLSRTLALVVVGALTLAGCQATNKEASFDSAVMEPSLGYAEAGADMAVEQSSPVVSMEPDVITTGYLSLIVDAPSEGADEITTIVVDAGGRIASRSDYSPTDFGQPTSYLEARIPADRLDATVELISAVGIVQDVSINTVDVSLQKIDLDARIAVLETSMARLGELLSTAETTSDLIAIETALAERQAELDSLTQQRSYLSDQTLFATVSINLATPEDAQPRDPDGFFDGILTGWESILAFFAGVVVWSGIAVPWLALGGVVIVLLLVVRTLIKKARGRSKASSNTP